MKVIPFSKTFSTATDYRAESNKSLIIKYIGTNSTSKVSVIVEGINAGEFNSYFAPITVTSDNVLGFFDLQDLYIVIPKGAKFRFEGPSGYYVYCEGDMLIHEFGEELPAEFKTRYNEQGLKRWTYLEGSYTSAAAASIPALAEYTVLDFTCPAGRTYVLNSIFEAEAYTSAGTIPRERLAHRIYINDNPIDNLDSTFAPFGISTVMTPRPPRMTLNAEPFTLDVMPIQLVPGMNLKVKVVNNGGSVTLATGETLVSNVLIVARYYVQS